MSIFIAHHVSRLIWPAVQSLFQKQSQGTNKNPISPYGEILLANQIVLLIPLENLHQSNFCPRETVGKFLMCWVYVLGVPRWPRMVCFGVWMCFSFVRSGLSCVFVRFLCLLGVDIFFWIIIPFFELLRDDLVLLFSLVFLLLWF